MNPVLILSMAFVLACFLGVVESAGLGTAQAAADVLQRVIPSHAHHFHLTVLGPDFGPTFNKKMAPLLPNTTLDTFTVLAQDGEVYINGSSAIALTSGAYWYLKNVTGCIVTWGENRTGDQLSLPTRLPNVEKTTITSAVPWRYSWNVCTFSYSAVWWTEERWLREIDWLALHGVNLPLAFTGLEYIWYKLMKDRWNVSLEALGEWFTGPAFLTWQRFGNIQRFNGPLSEHWLIGQRDLQRYILRHMRALGMTPVLPCFAGHLPQIAKKIWPRANLTESPAWNNFPSSDTYVYILDPADPLYHEIGSAFLQELVNEYGSDGYFNCDSFNEVDPTNTSAEYLRRAGAAVSNAITSVVPNGVWVMQAWLFHFSFWKNSSRVKAYLSGVDDDKMLILDLNSEEGTLANKLEQYFGKRWIWNMLHNYGGVRGVYGHMSKIAHNPVTDYFPSNSTMLGIGFTPEAIEQNPAMYELLTDTFWSVTPIQVMPWIDRYIRQRYGSLAAVDNATQLNKAWGTLFLAVYNQSGEPRSEIEWVPEWVTQSLGWENGNADLMYAAAQQYLAAGQAHPELAIHNGPYQYDLVDFTRQAVTMFFSDVHRMYDNACYSEWNATASLEIMTPVMLYLIRRLDDLLSTNPNYLLGTWTHGAEGWAATPAEAIQFMYSAKNQITMWGPRAQISDYAAKAWSGLYRDYYLGRWTLFANLVLDGQVNGNQWDEWGYQSTQLNFESTWDNSMDQYPTTPSLTGKDALAIAAELLQNISSFGSGEGLNGLGGPAKYVVFKGLNMVGGDYIVNPMWTNDPERMKVLCALTQSCVGFNTQSQMKMAKGNFRLDPGLTLYIRSSATEIIAAAEAFLNSSKTAAPHSQGQGKGRETLIVPVIENVPEGGTAGPDPYAIAKAKGYPIPSKLGAGDVADRSSAGRRFPFGQWNRKLDQAPYRNP